MTEQPLDDRVPGDRRARSRPSTPSDAASARFASSRPRPRQSPQDRDRRRIRCRRRARTPVCRRNRARSPPASAPGTLRASPARSPRRRARRRGTARRDTARRASSSLTAPANVMRSRAPLSSAARSMKGAMAAIADDDEPQVRRQVRHRADRQIDALVLLESRHRQHVVAVFAGRELRGQQRRMVERRRGETVVLLQTRRDGVRDRVEAAGTRPASLRRAP